MTKKILLSLVVTGSLSMYGAGGDTNNQNVIQEQNMVQVQNNDKIIDASLSLSQSLVELTSQLIESTANANDSYTKAMLQLSQDIGTMADRINTMADKIVTTQEIQSKNFQQTQKNMLKAQENTIEALNNLAQNDKVVSEEMKNLKNNIQATLDSSLKNMGLAENHFNNTQQLKAIQEIKKSIGKNPSVGSLVSMMDNVKPQYRYMVVNAIKTKLSEQQDKNTQVNSKDIENMRSEMLDLLDKERENKQSNISSRNNNMLDTTGMSKDKAFNIGGMDRGYDSSADMGDMMDASSVGGMGSSSSGGMGGSSAGGMGGMM